ncbi:MAG: iron ABC transporter permease [Planctomycetes bacterium]|nr:iron ABC transporter permease [Planctomycetota bacterium]
MTVRTRVLSAPLWYGLLLTGLTAGSLMLGSSALAAGEVLEGTGAMLGLCEPLERSTQAIVELRVWRALCTLGVGAALALSGGLIQGLFRNALASPSLIGVTGGASLGAACAILIVGGYAPRLVLESSVGLDALLVPLFSFVMALCTTALVAWIASARGRASVTTLLLVGIAVNMCVSGAFATIQYLTLEEWEVSRAILAWTFGTLDDRSGFHCLTVFASLAVSTLAVPFVARELDLLKGGEEDAEALGVDVARTKRVALVAAALAASAAVAVAGQIAFVGLVVPHLLRLFGQHSYRQLLWHALPAGAAFLLGADVLQRWLFGAGALQPGVMMSLVGGPFFLFLLVRSRREVSTW